MDAGAVPVLVALLSEGSMTAKENSVWALGHLAAGSDDLCGVIVDAGAVPVLSALLSEGSIASRENCRNALSYLTANI